MGALNKFSLICGDKVADGSGHVFGQFLPIPTDPDFLYPPGPELPLEDVFSIFFRAKTWSITGTIVSKVEGEVALSYTFDESNISPLIGISDYTNPEQLGSFILGGISDRLSITATVASDQDPDINGFVACAFVTAEPNLGAPRVAYNPTSKLYRLPLLGHSSDAFYIECASNPAYYDYPGFTPHDISGGITLVINGNSYFVQMIEDDFSGNPNDVTMDITMTPDSFFDYS